MCLYTKSIVNKRYVPTIKNNWGQFMEKCSDPRKLYVPVGCGHCIECVTQKRNSWVIRLSEEIKDHEKTHFVTLTFDDDAIQELYNDADQKDANSIAKLAVRRFLERWRKKYKKSVKHWLITELGDERCRIHLHGLIFTNKSEQEILDKWQYGFVRFGKYVNIKTINYITKYMLKGGSEKHKGFKQKIFTSAGIGKGYLKRANSKIHKYVKGEKIHPYVDERGFERSLPLYLRNKILTDKERDDAFTDFLDRQKMSIMGVEFDISTEEGIKDFNKRRDYERIKALQMGYNDNNYKEKNFPPSQKFIKKDQ
jgi:hypothetical protein